MFDFIKRWLGGNKGSQETPVSAPVEPPPAAVAPATEAPPADPMMTVEPAPEPTRPGTFDVAQLKTRKLPFLTHLHAAGIDLTDDDLSTVRLLRQVSQALTAADTGNPRIDRGVAEARTRFAADGNVNALVVSYLETMASHLKEEATALAMQPGIGDSAVAFRKEHQSLKDEYLALERDAAYHRRNPDVLATLVEAHPFILDRQHPATLAQIVVDSGKVASDPKLGADLVNSVIARKFVHECTASKLSFPPSRYLNTYADAPHVYATQIQAAADQVAEDNPSIRRAEVYNVGVPMLDRIEAVSKLSQAYMHEIASLEAEPQDKVAQLQALREHQRLVRHVVGSLAHHYLGDSQVNAAAGDPRTQDLREFVETTLVNAKQEPMPIEQALEYSMAIAQHAVIVLSQRHPNDREVAGKAAELLTGAGLATTVEDVLDLPSRIMLMQQFQARQAQEQEAAVVRA